MATTVATTVRITTAAPGTGCVDSNGVVYKQGRSFKQYCNICFCKRGGVASCTKRTCHQSTVAPPPSSTHHIDPAPPITDPLPCSVCTHCTSQVYNTFEQELAVFEEMIQSLDEENQMLRDNESKLLEKIKSLRANNTQNLEYIQNLEKSLENFQARIQKLETDNNNLRKEKNDLLTRIQNMKLNINININNSNNNNNNNNNDNNNIIKEEITGLQERIKQLETESKNLRDENNLLLAKIQDLEAQNFQEKINMLMEENNELKKMCKPECSSDTECPSYQACVR